MTPQEAAEYAQLALRVARGAGQVALRGYRRPKSVERKGQIDLVTEYDLEAEESIRYALGRETPSIPVVAEEHGGVETGELVWFADPIDGTTNYAHGHPCWSVSIGLLFKGVPVAGAVVAPSLQLEWCGSSGGQAFRNLEPCHVSDIGVLDDALVATGFPYDRRTSQENNFAAFEVIKMRTMGVRRCGSAALDLCLVADGTYDGYWEGKLKPWDISAGIAIVRAAGGQVTSYDGGAPDVHVGHIIATNGLIHEAMQKALSEARAPRP